MPPPLPALLAALCSEPPRAALAGRAGPAAPAGCEKLPDRCPNLSEIKEGQSSLGVTAAASAAPEHPSSHRGAFPGCGAHPARPPPDTGPQPPTPCRHTAPGQPRSWGELFPLWSSLLLPFTTTWNNKLVLGLAIPSSPIAPSSGTQSPQRSGTVRRGAGGSAQRVHHFKVSFILSYSSP